MLSINCSYQPILFVTDTLSKTTSTGVQTRGYIDGSVLMGAITIPENIRMMPGFVNVRADQGLGPINNHGGLPTKKVWDELVKKYLINN